jgi:hypothetical protein
MPPSSSLLGRIMANMNVRKAPIMSRCSNFSLSLAEMRLATATYYAIGCPISLFWYGWSTYYKVHWIVPILGMIPYGFGMLGVFIPCQQYLVDAFSQYAASSVAAVRTSVSIIGAFLPLAGPPIYSKLGLGWGNSLLGFITLLMTPIPLLFYK